MKQMENVVSFFSNILIQNVEQKRILGYLLECWVREKFGS